ncbi:hypothetical protein LCGC14_1407460 [marine sediment metagenome]|uniref:Uncharacterized protein n=1 Tax=marine sediment metagenome TaxID=412755 RepID=A0A0F9KG68_9ZZZZ
MALFPPRPQFNISYDWIDVASGSGYQRFYGIKSNITGSIAYNLTNALFVTGEYNENMSTSNTDTLFLSNLNADPEINLDTNVFNLPRVINGVPLVSIPVAVSPPDGGVDNIYCTVRLIKVTAAPAEVELTAAVTSVTIGGNESTGGTKSLLNTCITLALPNITNQIIKKGEKIRLEIIYTSDATTSYAFFNPSSSSLTMKVNDGFVTAPYTNLEVDIPFKLDFL